MKQKKKIILLVLNILTILSIPGVLYTLSFINKGKPLSLFWEYMTPVCWIWLIIPITSIVVSKKQDAGEKVLKNKIIGIIVATILFMEGIVGMITPNISIDYSKMKEQEKILGVTLLKTGKVIEREESSLYQEITNERVYTIYYNKKIKIEKLTKEIKSNSNWIKWNQLDSNIKSMVPEEIRIIECKDCYILFYNEDTKEYNQLIEKGKKQSIITANYNLETRSIEIYHYDYSY